MVKDGASNTYTGRPQALARRVPRYVGRRDDRAKPGFSVGLNLNDLASYGRADTARRITELGLPTDLNKDVGHMTQRHPSDRSFSHLGLGSFHQLMTGKMI